MRKLPNKLYAIVAAASFLVPNAAVLADANPAAGNASNGAKVWASNCGRCHEIRGAKELRDDQWISTMFHMRIRGGLTGQDTRDVLSFMQSSNNNKVVKYPHKTSSSASTKATAGLTGKDIYTQTCIACHGGNGTGVLPGTPNFTDKTGRLAKSDAQLMDSLMNGVQSPGSPMAMPAKGGNDALTKGDLKNVLQYLRDTFGS